MDSHSGAETLGLDLHHAVLRCDGLRRAGAVYGRSASGDASSKLLLEKTGARPNGPYSGLGDSLTAISDLWPDIGAGIHVAGLSGLSRPAPSPAL